MSDTCDRYNDDELHPPQWLDEEFFSKLLKEKNQKQNTKINKIQITPGTSKSDHYASIMFRVKLNYFVDNGAEKAISMIVKTTPIIEGEKKELLGKFSLFETEIKMYSETLPQIEQILRSHGDDTKLCSNLLYSSLKPYKCLIFEDLCELGYTTINNRHATIEEVKMAFLKLAKLHAVSYKLAKEGDTSITSFKEGIFNDSKILDLPLAANAVKTMKAILADEKDLAYFIPLFEKIENKLFERLFATFNAVNQNGERHGILVLNHGDFHIKNMMIKVKSGKLQDLMLVDYQISVFATAAIDVMYAIIMLFSPDMRLNHRDELIYYYFTNFQKTLKTIGFKGHIPKIIDFQQEMLKHSHWELFLFISFIIFSYVLTDGDGDLSKSIEDENYRLAILKRPEVIAEFRAILPKMLYKGYFDFQK